jgi:hypothetical protein
VPRQRDISNLLPISIVQVVNEMKDHSKWTEAAPAHDKRAISQAITTENQERVN